MKTTYNILQTVGYFDIFCYPLTVSEIHRFLGKYTTIPEVETGLQELVNKKQLFQLDEFYSLQNDMSIAHQRRKGNERAGRLLPVAYRIGSLLGKFPFVRAVGISGSLSKNYADEQADFDFFIITKTNHLWIARSMLHVLKKLSFLLGKQHWYCMNYFIDEQALVIAEKNIFIATEVLTLKPVCGDEAMSAFFKANQWALDHLPNYPQTASVVYSNTFDPWYKKLVEFLFTNRFGNWLDDWLMRVTEKRWLKKERENQLNIKGDPLGLLAGKHFARLNPEHFQKKFLMLYQKKLEEINSTIQL